MSASELFAYDRDLNRRLIIGTDEAGRGCLAGPIVAAGVLFDYAQLDADAESVLSSLGDSKTKSAKVREALVPLIVEHAVGVVVSSRTAAQIDRDGIQSCNLAVLRECLQSLHTPGALGLVDGFKLPDAPEHHQIIRGDSTSAAVAAASIIAKVTRDELMSAAHSRYPQWGFDRNAGYGTKAHQAALAEHGLSPLHRRSFRQPGLDAEVAELPTADSD